MFVVESAHFNTMGTLFSTLFDKLSFRKKQWKLLVLGLDNAGKTTFLYQLKLGEVVNTAPTIGFNVETIKYKRCSFTCWDVGGQKKIRSLWRHYYRGSDGLIFLVDSADNGQERMADVREQLHRMLECEELRDIKVLVMANKQDMKDAAKPSTIASNLFLHDLGNEWRIQGCVSTTGEGVYEGLNWLIDAMKKNKS